MTKRDLQGTDRWKSDSKSKAMRNREQVERGFIEAAKQEPSTGPLEVASLDSKLAAALPGARLEFDERKVLRAKGRGG